MAKGNRIEVRAVQAAPIALDAEFTCGEGELLALVGPSGSGKTTLLRTVAGLYRPSRAHVACAEEVWLDTAQGINLPPHRRRVGLVFQNYALFPHMTAHRNVEIAIGHRPHAERAARAQALLDLVHLQDLAHRRPAELSGGQQQRVALARALAREPAVLLLDEPFSAVDRPTRRRLHAELMELRQSIRIPIVLVTHDIDEAAALADRICVLDRGESLQTGRPDQVMAAPANARVAAALDLLPSEPLGHRLRNGARGLQGMTADAGAAGKD